MKEIIETISAGILSEKYLIYFFARTPKNYLINIKEFSQKIYKIPLKLIETNSFLGSSMEFILFSTLPFYFV